MRSAGCAAERMIGAQVVAGNVAALRNARSMPAMATGYQQLHPLHMKRQHAEMHRHLATTEAASSARPHEMHNIAASQTPRC